MILILDAINACLPPRFHITHLIFLDPDWQVNASDGEHIAVATGPTVEEALAAIHEKVARGSWAGHFHFFDSKLTDDLERRPSRRTASTNSVNDLI